MKQGLGEWWIGEEREWKERLLYILREYPEQWQWETGRSGLRLFTGEGLELDGKYLVCVSPQSRTDNWSRYFFLVRSDASSESFSTQCSRQPPIMQNQYIRWNLFAIPRSDRQDSMAHRMSERGEKLWSQLTWGFWLGCQNGKWHYWLWQRTEKEWKGKPWVLFCISSDLKTSRTSKSTGWDGVWVWAQQRLKLELWLERVPLRPGKWMPSPRMDRRQRGLRMDPWK